MKMALKGLLIGLCVFHVTLAVQLTSVITPDDGKRLLQYFKAPFKDLESAYYALTGLKHYTQGGAIGTAEKQSACKLAKTCDTKSLTSLHYSASVLNQLGSSCKHEFGKEVMDFVKSKVSETSDAKTLYAAVSVLQNLGQKVDGNQVTGAFLSVIKEDNSVIISSLALLAVSKLSNPNLASLLKTADIEDMAAQADEVDERFSHFENDLEVTSTFLSAVFSVSEASKKDIMITPDQVILFANFLLRSKTSASSVKEASLILSGLGSIASSSKITVAKAEIESGSSISEDNPSIAVYVGNIFAQPISKLTVKAESVVRASDNEVIISNVPFKYDGVRDYQLTLYKNNPKSGFYDVTMTVTSMGKQLVGVSDLEFKVKITTKVAIVNIELGTAEKEQANPPLKRVNYPTKAGELRADSQQKVVMKFQVQDLNDKSLIAPHQAFVRFSHEKTGQEVIFVAEADKDLTFKFEVDLSTSGREHFNSVSGKYSMHLIVGDAAISNPHFWNFGEITLNLGDEPTKQKPSAAAQYSLKPEIHHLFRKPEERPPAIVSQAFTVACLAPLLILFILWARVGANLSDFRFSFKNLIFHVGLAGIFVLYYMFWIKWNMFTTVQYLCGVGVVTFLFGNSVLSDIANQR